MKEVIELYKKVVVQIATPYSTGTGFVVKDANLIVTNEHVIRGNATVIIESPLFQRQISKVVYIDQKHDLAFLSAPSIENIPDIDLLDTINVSEGDAVIAVGHPFGLKYTATQGIISNTKHIINSLNYYQHDAALNPGNSGGPLVNKLGQVIGINTFIIQNGNSIGFSLPSTALIQAIDEFLHSGATCGTRCASCTNLVTEKTIEQNYCPSCGSKVALPSSAPEYVPKGVCKTIEEIISKTGNVVALSRLGPNSWQIIHGSAKISISYHEKTGMITGDAFLCKLPKENIKAIYEYLLRQNYELDGLSLSILGQEIVISLVMYDRYLKPETGLKLFNNLLHKADDYDDILIHEFGAIARTVD